MARLRRFGVALTAGLFAASFVGAAPATADTPEVFVGNAAGRALGLNVLGTDLSLGASSATAAGTNVLNAVSKGAGQLLDTPLGNATTVTSKVTVDGISDVQAEKCGPVSLPAEVGSLITLNTACASSVAEIKAGLPHAASTGSVANLGLSANTVTTQILDAVPIGPVLTQIQAALPNTGTQLDAVKTTVFDLVDSVLTTKTLDVSLGKSTSDVTATAANVTSTATASGAVVKILPTPDLVNSLGVVVNEPLVTIIVGDAKAAVTYDRASGTSTPTFDPALVRVKLNSALASALGLPAETAIAPGVDTVVPLTAGTPLESRIIVGAGRKFTNPDGTVGAMADGVKLELLKGINGGITLELAHAQADLGGKPALKVLGSSTPGVVAPITSLPRTGGTPWIPMVGAGMLGLAIVVRRWVISPR